MIKALHTIADYATDRFSKLFFRYAEKRSKRAIIFLTICILTIILLFGWISSKKVREVVIEDFNQQQLILARHAALQAEKNLDIAKREMLILSQHGYLRDPNPVFLSRQLPLSYSRLVDEGVVAIRYYDAGAGIIYQTDASGYNVVRPTREDHQLYASARQLKGSQLFHFASSVSAGPDGEYRQLLSITKVVRREADRDAALHSVPPRGALIFVIDATTVAERLLKELKSGKTGYAWIIDGSGTFLYHPESSFIGKNAFEARKERQPAISFQRIELIQQQKMLKGEEGTSWYLSGWHRGIEGNIRKLIAYSPIRIAAAPEKLIWSVAVVAPMSEVEGAIEEIQLRQYLLEGIIIIVIIIGSLIAFSLMARWSSSLKSEVDRKTAELAKSENQYRSLVENANDIIFTVDRDGIITTINKAGSAFFMRPEEEIEGRNLGEICFNETSAALQYKTIDEVFATGESRQIIYSLLIKGVEYWVSTNFSILSDGDGRPASVLGISRDITASKKREREEHMYHTEKLASMGTLAAGVAHEINNPLGIILGFSDLLLERSRPETEEYDMLKTIEKHGLNAKRVVENLLSFARYSEHREESVDVNKNIESVLVVVKNTLLLNRIRLNKQLPDGLPQVKGDPGELQQVFLNIINNAIHVMRGGGTLTIATRLNEESGRVEIRLSDTGQGILKEHRSRIFDPLFTTKKVGEGTGLGLSVTYGIVTKHGGTISFETKTPEESPAHGTTFTIELQAVQE